MASDPLLYGFVARGSVILVGRAPASVPLDVIGIAADCLQRLSQAEVEEKKLIYEVADHTFLFLLEDGYVYAVVARTQVANSGSKREKLFVLLNRVMEDFIGRYGAGVGGVADTAREYDMEREFGPLLRKFFSVFNERNSIDAEADKVAKVNAQVQEVKSAMMSNIVRMIDRGDNIDVVVEKTDGLRDQAEQFRSGTNRLKRKLQWRNYKTTMIVIAIIIVLILIIFFWACHGVKCTK